MPSLSHHIADRCAFKKIWSQESPQVKVLACHHLGYDQFDTLRDCKEWVCSIGGNGFNARGQSCIAKKCLGEVAKLTDHHAAFDVYVRI